MTVNCEDCKQKLSTTDRLARIETKLDAMNQRFEEVVVTQLKDHGKRITAIEKRWWILIGYMVGSGLLGGAFVKYLM